MPQVFLLDFFLLCFDLIGRSSRLLHLSMLVLLFFQHRVTNSLRVISDAHSPGWRAMLWPRMIRLKIPLIPLSWRDASWVGILWISTINLLNWLCQSLFRSKVSHSCRGPIPGQHTSFKYWYKSFKFAFKKIKDPIQELSRLTYFSVWQLQVKPSQHNSLASPWHGCTWIIFYELLSQFYSGVRLRCPPWESPSEHYLDGGLSPKSITHTWLVLSLLCSNVSSWFGTSVFVDSFCLALHTRLCHSHELHFALRDTDETLPLHESFQQRIAVNQCYVFAICQVPASCQGPQFHYFSHSPWTRPLPQQATPSCLVGEMANSPVWDLWEVVWLAWHY